MTKAELIAALSEVTDDAEIVLDVWRGGILRDTTRVPVEGVAVSRGDALLLFEGDLVLIEDDEEEAA